MLLASLCAQEVAAAPARDVVPLLTALSEVASLARFCRTRRHMGGPLRPGRPL
jgi:hypothetical protein